MTFWRKSKGIFQAWKLFYVKSHESDTMCEWDRHKYMHIYVYIHKCSCYIWHLINHHFWQTAHCITGLQQWACPSESVPLCHLCGRTDLTNLCTSTVACHILSFAADKLTLSDMDRGPFQTHLHPPRSPSVLIKTTRCRTQTIPPTAVTEGPSAQPDGSLRTPFQTVRLHN